MLCAGALLSPCQAAVISADAAVAAANPLAVLSTSDAQKYAQAFAAMRRSDLIAGQNGERGIADPAC